MTSPDGKGGTDAVTRGETCLTTRPPGSAASSLSCCSSSHITAALALWGALTQGKPSVDLCVAGERPGQEPLSGSLGLWGVLWMRTFLRAFIPPPPSPVPGPSLSRCWRPPPPADLSSPAAGIRRAGRWARGRAGMSPVITAAAGGVGVSWTRFG